MRWEAAAIVLGTRPFGETDALASVFSAEYGVYRGLARGAEGRRAAALWQRGNLLAVRWGARLAEQLGSFSAELIHPTAALAIGDPLRLAMLDALVALAQGALPEREPEPDTFAGLVCLVLRLDEGALLLPEIARWENKLLSDLGYGLDFSGVKDVPEGNPVFVSPRTGRAVDEETAGRWRDRLFPLPPFLRADVASTPRDWRDAFRLTGHFLEHTVFASRHRPLPEARRRLYDRISAMAEEKETP